MMPWGSSDPPNAGVPSHRFFSFERRRAVIGRATKALVPATRWGCSLKVAEVFAALISGLHGGHPLHRLNGARSKGERSARERFKPGLGFSTS